MSEYNDSSEKWNLSWLDVAQYADQLVETCRDCTESGRAGQGLIKLYGVPRGGIYAAHALECRLKMARVPSFMVEDPEQATVIVDDLIDSGKTRDAYLRRFPSKPFVVLVNKELLPTRPWISFPWERMQNESGPEDAIIRLLQYIGEDVSREGLTETPARVIKSYSELFSGYKQDPKELFKVFDGGGYDEMVVVRDIAAWSFCEHHLLPFFGTVTVGYIPQGGRIIGVSKIARLVEVFARRLQVQERLTEQIANAIQEGLDPLGVGVVMKAKHLCMSCRGAKQPTAIMLTSKLLGAFREGPVRHEFLSLRG